MKIYAAGLNRTTVYQGSLASLSATGYDQNIGANVSVIYPVPITGGINTIFSPVTTNKVDAITTPYIPNSYNLANYATAVAAEQAKMASFLQERIIFIKNDSDVAKTISLVVTDQSVIGTFVEASLFDETYSELNGTLLGFVNQYGYAIDACLINHDSQPAPTVTTPGAATFVNIPAGHYKPLVLKLFGVKDIAVPEDYVIISTVTT